MAAQSITALLGGHIDAAATAVSAVVLHVRSGQLRAIAVPAPQRLGGPLATVPTWVEQGVNGALSVLTPQPVLRRARWQTAAA